MSRIYFIANHAKNAVKIGVADNPKARLSSLQTGCLDELSILAEMPGNEHYEAALHRAFDEYAIRGEWFRLEGKLEQFVSLLPEFPASEKKYARELKAEQPQPRRLNKAAFDKHWQEMLALIREAVDFVGIDKFAAAVGAQRGNVANALHERHNRHFHYRWFCSLLEMLPKERSLVLLNHMALPMGLRFITPEEIEQERAARERLDALRTAIRERLGEEGEAWLAAIEAEWAEEERRNRAAFDEQWFETGVQQ